MLDNHVEKPQERGNFRKYFGKEYFIMKRKWKWLTDGTRHVSRKSDFNCPHSIIKHKSFLLRPLKDVDMILQHNKVTNLRLAIAHIDGIVIQPGETMSLWKLVGRPTKGKGYLDGLVLHNGTTTRGVGGGLCQLGNLLFWMILHSELNIVERYRHGFDVFPDINRTIPFGCGATLSYNYIDFQIKNNTEDVYKINLWLDDEYLNGELLSSARPNHTFKVIETDHLIKQQWWGGYTRHNKIWKQRFSLTGEYVNEELVAENHAIMMYNPLLEKAGATKSE